MRGRPGRGVVVGFVVGLLLVAALIWFPDSRQIDFAWITNTFVYAGLPLIVICSAAGALVGALWSSGAVTPDAGGQALAVGSPEPSTRTRTLVVLGAVGVIVLAIWVFLGATAMVSVSPLDLPWPLR